MKINFRILMVFFVVFGFTVHVFGASSSKDITLIYTGETHGMLYPCNCPIEPDGGVARMASLVKQIRNQYPDSLLLSTGAFFAGGQLDQYSQNTELDKQRSTINLKSMELMKYDVAAVGDDEFNFGKVFLSDNIAKSGINFISANVKTDKISPYIIKEVGGIKVGIAAVTTLEVSQKAQGLQVLDPKDSVASAVKALKAKGAKIIVLLSHLSEDDDIALTQEVKGIDVLITGHALVYKGKLPDKINGTLFLRPAWEGRRLSRVVLNIKDNKIMDYKVEDMRLSNKIPDDPEILNILPRCFSEANCRKDGLIGACENAGSMSSACMFSKPNKIDLTVITPKACLTCETESFVGYLKKLFPGLKVTYLSYPDNGKSVEMVKKFNLNTLPVYLIEKKAESEKNFAIIKKLVDLKGEYYLPRPKLAGVGYFVNRVKTKGSLDVFLSLFDKDAADTLEVLKDFNPNLHFNLVYGDKGFDARFGNVEIEEDLRSVCMKKYYPDKFWDYISCRAKNINSSWWDNCLSGVDMGKIKTCACGNEGKILLQENSKLNKELHMMNGLAYLVDNTEVFATRGVPSQEELKKIIKR